MKIAFLITRMDEYGGAQVHVRDLAKWLKQKGHNPIVLSGWPGEVSEDIEDLGIEYEEIPDLVRAIHPLKDIKAFWQVRKKLKRAKVDIVACHSSKAGLIGRLACASLRIPVVFTAHGWAFTDNVPQPGREMYTIMEKIGGRFSTHIITVSEFDRELALGKHIIQPRKLTAIHNGMPVTPYQLANKYDSGQDLRLIMVARFGPQKDHETLIRALAKIKDMRWTLDLVGGGENSEIKSLAGSLGLSDKIRFLGERDDVATCLVNSDVFCLISNWEGFPLSILEAMRAGLPVVATDVGGVREAMVDRETGHCPPHKDTDALSSNLKHLIEHPETVAEMGLAGRKRFERYFTLDRMANETLNIYEGVLSEFRRDQEVPIRSL